MTGEENQQWEVAQDHVWDTTPFHTAAASFTRPTQLRHQVYLRATLQITVNNQIVVGTLMNLCDNPTRVSVGQDWLEKDSVKRIPIILTGEVGLQVVLLFLEWRWWSRSDWSSPV